MCLQVQEPLQSATPLPEEPKRMTPVPTLTHEQQTQIEWLRKGELDDSDQEIERLVLSGKLNQEESDDIQHTITRFQYTYEFFRRDYKGKETLEKLNHIKAILLQAKIIQNILKGTHKIFFHAQDSNWMGPLFLINAMEKKFNHQKAPHFIHCRSSNSMNCNEKIDKYLYNNKVDDHTPVARKELISVSSSLEQPTGCRESACDVLCINYNVYDNQTPVYQKEIQGRFSMIFHKEVLDFIQKINEFIEKNKSNTSCGNLIVFCIPEAESRSVVYQSEPYGIPKGVSSATSLQRSVAQMNAYLPDQFRIFVPALHPNLHRIYYLSRVPKEVRKGLKKLINEELNKFEALSKSRVALITSIAFASLILFSSLLFVFVNSKSFDSKYS